MSKDPKTENVEAKTTAPAPSAPALPEPEVVDEDDEFEVSNLFHPPPLPYLHPSHKEISLIR
jgi:hypothetical protein